MKYLCLAYESEQVLNALTPVRGSPESSNVISAFDPGPKPVPRRFVWRLCPVVSFR